MLYVVLLLLFALLSFDVVVVVAIGDAVCAVVGVDVGIDFVVDYMVVGVVFAVICVVAVVCWRLCRGLFVLLAFVMVLMLRLPLMGFGVVAGCIGVAVVVAVCGAVRCCLCLCWP